MIPLHNYVGPLLGVSRVLNQWLKQNIYIDIITFLGYLFRKGNDLTQSNILKLYRVVQKKYYWRQYRFFLFSTVISVQPVHFYNVYISK